MGVFATPAKLAPSCMRVRIKGSKTDPFRKGCFIHIGVGRRPLCAVRAVMNYLALRGDAPGPLFFFAKWTASLAQHLDGLASTDYGLSAGAGKLLQP